MLPRRILHCTDFSDNSGPALKCALEYAQAFEAELLILHVIDTWAGLPAYEEGFYVQVREAFAQTEQSSAAKLESMQADCERLTRKVRTFTATGVPAEEIVRLAEAESADLIVMGTHGWSGIKHMLLGSVAEKVLRAADCPVMIVRSRA